MGKKIIHGMSIGVIIYVIAYMIMTFIYCSPRILAEFSNFDVSHINENFEFPLDIFSWGLLIICSACSGVDLGVGKRFKMEYKQTIESSKIFLVTILLVATLLESVVLSYFLGHDYIVITDYGKQVFKGISLPLEGIATAIVSACTFLFTGNQLSNIEEEKTENEKID